MRYSTLASRLLVLAAVIFGLVLLFPEYRLDAPPFNDNGVLHQGLAEYAATHWAEHWPVDYWYPSVSTGFPMFASYPHLSQLTAAALAHWFEGDARRIYETLRYLLQAMLPLSIFVSLRRLGLSRATSTFAALLYPLITAGYDGIDWSSYVWRGHGLGPQLWGVFFLFPTLAWGYQAIRTGRCWIAGVLLAVCTLSHFLYGYMAALSLFVLAILPDPSTRWPRRLMRLIRIGAVAASMTAYFVVPFLLNRGELLKSRWEPVWKWDSMGWEWVLTRLLHGEIFDSTPIPAITILAAVGVVVAARKTRRGDDRQRWLLVCFVLWAVLLCGRATFGRVMDLLPLASGLHMHRFIGGMQVFGLILAASGLETIWRWFQARPWAEWQRLVAGGCVVGAVVLGPATMLVRYMRANDYMAATAKVALQRADDLRGLVGALHDLPPGRVHAGFAGTWGEQFTIGGVPVYAHLQRAGFDMVGYLFMAMARPGEWQVRLDYRRPDHCDLYNLRYLLVPDTVAVPEFATLQTRRGTLSLYEVPVSGYFMLGRITESAADELSTKSVRTAPWEQIYQLGDRWLAGPEPGRAHFIALDDESVAPSPLAESARPSGAVTRELVRSGSYDCEVDGADQADLILKVTYHPYWHAWVDDTETRVRPVIPGFMAIRVEPGRHAVRFRYQPPPWKKGLFLLALMVPAGAFVAPLLTMVRRRRADAT